MVQSNYHLNMQYEIIYISKQIGFLLTDKKESLRSHLELNYFNRDRTAGEAAATLNVHSHIWQELKFEFA